MMKFPGTVYPKGKMWMLTHVGTAFDPDTGNKYDMNLSVSNMAPIVKHPDGRSFVLSWDEIVGMARAQFDAREKQHD